MANEWTNSVYSLKLYIKRTKGVRAKLFEGRKHAVVTFPILLISKHCM